MQTMLHRLYADEVRRKLARYPAVALLGSRQCGKTTLARALGGHYFDLETAGDASRLDAEWDELAAGRRLVVLDEAQHEPRVFDRLRGAIDADRRRKGRFLLLGSVSPALLRDGAESLAGRLGIVHLSPFVLPELPAARADRLWLVGGYPDGGILRPRMFPEWQHDYLETLVSRDLPAWGLPARPQQTLRLLHMLAAVHGQPLNASQLGAALGLDHKTVLGRCDWLEGAFLVRRLPPFSANVRKRLVKTPRLYWRDSGILHALLGVTGRTDLFRRPWLGASWEGFVIEQTLSVLAAVGRRDQAFFFRSSDGVELDLLLERGEDRWAVEIKLTSNPSPDDVRRLNAAADLVAASRRFLVCRTSRDIETRSLLVTNLARWLDLLRSPPSRART
jgi:predicted AAA+ superfamily ATPase